MRTYRTCILLYLRYYVSWMVKKALVQFMAFSSHRLPTYPTLFCTTSNFFHSELQVGNPNYSSKLALINDQLTGGRFVLNHLTKNECLLQRQQIWSPEKSKLRK